MSGINYKRALIRLLGAGMLVIILSGLVAVAGVGYWVWSLR